MCGAAALTMVYQAVGVPCDQLAVWQRVAEEIRPGVRASRTHRLALDALQQGLPAVTLQAEEPVAALRHLLENDTRVILNHRLDSQSHLGHYTVLLGLDEHEIEIHDPYHGPNRILPWPEFAELWGPPNQQSEIVGHILVAIGSALAGSRGPELPPSPTCPRCSQPVPRGPASTWDSDAARRERLWKRRFCPHCDWAVRL